MTRYLTESLLAVAAGALLLVPFANWLQPGIWSSASGIEAGTGETPEEAARCEAREPARTPETHVLLEKKDV